MPRPRNPRPPRPAPLRPGFDATLFIPPGEVFESVLAMQLHGQMVINIFHYRVNVLSAPGVGEGSCNVQISNIIVPDIRAATSTELSFLSVTTRRLTTPTSVPTILQFNPGTTGNLVGPSHPSFVAAVMSLRSTLRSGRGRGRIYVAGVRETDSSLGQLLTAEITILSQLATDMKAPFTPTGGPTYTPVIVSRKGSNLITGSVRYSDVSNILVVPVLGSVRRRRIGRGR